MRFVIMHKMTEQLEKGLPPEPAVIEEIGKLIEEAIKDKAFVSGEGLKPTATRVHLAYQGGKRTLTRAPFAGARELPAGFALMRVKSEAEALSWCDRFAALVGDVKMFLGPVVEPWDLGAGSRPEGAPLRFLSVHQADARSESDEPPSAELMAKMGALVEEMTRAGVLESAGGLASTKRGARVHFEGGKHTVIDGPFTESKELVAGYAILDLPSKAAAIDWAVRFGDVVKVHEVELRQMPEF